MIQVANLTFYFIDLVVNLLTYGLIIHMDGGLVNTNYQNHTITYRSPFYETYPTYRTSPFPPLFYQLPLPLRLSRMCVKSGVYADVLYDWEIRLIKLFTLTFIVYSLYAILPFIQVGRHLHYLLGAVFAVTGSLIWVTISRTVDKSHISLYGLYFDAIITISFFAVPLLFTGANFTFKQVVGIILIVTGILISKL